ncbi:hypothetical protein SprV_0301180100 [Sparganum proliferum]
MLRSIAASPSAPLYTTRANGSATKVSVINLPGSFSPGLTFYVRDTRSGRRFLVDNGAQSSVISPTAADCWCPNPGLSLCIVNTSPSAPSAPDPSPWTSVSCVFSIRSSSLPTSPVQFSVQTFSPLSIFWSTVGSPGHAARPPTSPYGVFLLSTLPGNPCQQLLSRYPGLTRLSFSAAIPPHDVHHIRTNGPLVFSQPRHLAPGRLAATKAELERMLQMGIIRQSKSPWGSSLHLVPKAAVLASLCKSMFSKIYLIRDFHQIPTAPDDVSKTVIDMPFRLSEFLRMPFGLRNSSKIFQRKSSSDEIRYSTFGRELLAVFLSVKHFRHFLEGRDFTVFIDHKLLSSVLKSTPDKFNSQEICQLDHISQFTSDTRQIDRLRNEVSDALSRSSIVHLQLSPGIDPVGMADEQRQVRSSYDEDVSGRQLQSPALITGNGTILCDIFTASHRPFLQPSLHSKVFSFHPGSPATDNLASDRFL